mmetsp:Transcript_9982/g.16385  ORF Transcript_9982/g.16385 Transcript_9982/m.16385 type:complete len:825 (-) Transcript_9982:946-3420(-)
MEQPSISSLNSRQSSRHSSPQRSRRSHEGSSRSRGDDAQHHRNHRPRPQRQEGQRFDYDKQDDHHRRRRSRSESNKQSSNEHSSYRSQSSRGSTASRDPDGEYDDCNNGCEPSHRSIDVELYASTARKKASLMTNYDFNKSREESSSGRTSRDRRASASSTARERVVREGQARASPSRRADIDDENDQNHNDAYNHNDDGNVQTYFKEQVHAEHIPPPTATSMVGQFIPSSARSTATSVSSMSSKDSYVRQQEFLRDLERYKRVLRESRRNFDQIGEEEDEGDAEYGYGEEEHIIYEDYEDEEENSLFQNESIQFSETGEGDGLEKSFSIFSSDDVEKDAATYSVGSRGGGNKRHSVSTSSRTKASSTRSAHFQKRSAVASPVYQLEECCIKHPQVLLQDQTKVNVWTCMRYCKDPRTGRWVTVKKVCTQCLRELGDSYDDRDWQQHASMYDRSRSTRSSGNRHSHYKDEYGVSHSTDETWSSSSEDEEVGHRHSQYNHSKRGTTVNVYGDDGNQTPLEREAEAQRRRFARRLAARAYHFPGNNWIEDWLQYTKNTHLVFGIFFHHPLHPVTGKERCIILLGSVAVGLLMSNLIYLWFVEAEFGMHDPVLTLGPGGNVVITKLMVTLWTLGSFAHTIFDLSIWHIKACTLCRLLGGHVSERAVKCGRSTGVTIVLFTLAFATYLVLLRASEDFKASLISSGSFNSTSSTTGIDSHDSGGEADNSFFHSVVLGGGAEYFDFLLGYFVEFILAVFVYNPLILTVVFTGMLGCDGRIPILGGRPREVAKEQRYAMKRQRYIMPQTLKLGDNEYEADLWCDQKLATNF